MRELYNGSIGACRYLNSTPTTNKRLFPTTKSSIQKKWNLLGCWLRLEVWWKVIGQKLFWKFLYDHRNTLGYIELRLNNYDGKWQFLQNILVHLYKINSSRHRRISCNSDHKREPHFHRTMLAKALPWVMQRWNLHRTNTWKHSPQQQIPLAETIQKRKISYTMLIPQIQMSHRTPQLQIISSQRH